MNLDQYRNFIKGLPIPSAEQYEEFAHHLFTAHSWYKHVPGETLLFSFCLAPDAGTGRMEAYATTDGSFKLLPSDQVEFTEEHPRLHHSWRTTADYRKRFGYLDYFYDSSRDAGHVKFSIPDDLLPQVQIPLIPSVQKSDYKEEDKLNLLDLFASGDPLLRALKETEEPAIALKAYEELPNDQKTDALYQKKKQAYFESFDVPYNREIEKVRTALRNLDHWLKDNL